MQQGPAPRVRPQCGDHIIYATRAEAEAAFVKYVNQAKEHGREGKAWKRLNVFRCWIKCKGWHVGHAKEKFKTVEQPAPKPLSPGAARRKMEHELKEAERHTRRAEAYRDYVHSRSVAYAELDKELALAAAQKGGK